MPNLQGWVTPENDMQGLSKVTDDLQRQNAYKAHQAQLAESKKAASTKFFANYLDDKEKFTGTKYDPYTHQLTSEALNQAMGLVKEGANDSDIMAAISPLVNKVSQYTVSAQQYAANKKAALERVKGVKGIDQQKFAEEMDKQAFDGKEVWNVDPNVNYADMALKNGDVFNEEGFDESFLKAPKNTEDATMVNTNARGGRERTKVKLTSPYYATSEKDAEGNHVGFVPKYQTATDSGNELIHEFETEQGKVKAPIRLYDQDLFNAMQPEEKAYVRQEARKYAAAKGADLSAPQMENFARALAYDLKKSRINGSYVHQEETKANPIHIYTGRGPTVTEKKQAVSKQGLYDTLDSRPVDETGNINISDIFNGIAVMRNSKGNKISQGEVYYNPSTKNISYFDGEKVIKKPVYEVATIAEPANPNADVSMIRNLQDYARKSDLKENKGEEQVGTVRKLLDNIFGGRPKTKEPASAKPVNGLKERGNIDLAKQPSVDNPFVGGKSTVWSMSIGTDKGEVLISRVTPEGKVMTEDEAIKYYEKTGKHLGVFDTPEAATKYAKQLHEDYESGKIKNATDNKASKWDKYKK